MKKRWLATVLSIALLLGLFVPAGAEETSVEDVEAQAIEAAVEELPEMELPLTEDTSDGMEEQGSSFEDMESLSGWEETLTVNGVTYSGDMLKTNFSATDEEGHYMGWIWEADGHWLGLDRSGYGTYGGVYKISYTGEELHIHTQMYVGIMSITGNTVTLTGSGSELRPTSIDVGTLIVGDNAQLTYNGDELLLDSLVVDDGTINVKNLTASGEVRVVEDNTDSINVSKLNVSGTLKADSVSVAAGEHDISSLTANSVSVSGGSVKVGTLINCGDYSQTGGTVETAGIHADENVTATGGKLFINNEDPETVAIRAETVSLGGTLRAELVDDSHLFEAGNIDVPGLTDRDDISTALLMNNGHYRRFSDGDDTTAGLLIGDELFTEYEIKNNDLSGPDWRWDHRSKTLTLCGLTGDVGLSQFATIVLQDGSSGFSINIALAAGGKITGYGNYGGTIYVDSGDLTLVDCGAMGDMSIASLKGNINVDNCFIGGGSIATQKGNITFKKSVMYKGSLLCALGGDLTISDSMVYASNNHHDAYDIYADGALKVTSSLLFCTDYYGKKSSKVDKYSPVFRAGASSDHYMTKSATLKRSYALPYGSYEVYKKATLTIAKGCSLTYYGNLRGLEGGKIKGTVLRVSDYSGDVFSLEGDSRQVVGTSQQLKPVLPKGTIIRFIDWSSNKPWLARVDGQGVVTLTAEAAEHIGETVTITARDHDGSLYAEWDVTIAPGALAVELSDFSPIELWLDPINNTRRLSATVKPSSASQRVVWKTDSPKLLQVDADGNITAKAAGKASVWAETADGTGIRSDKVSVNVLKAPSSVKLNVKKKTLNYDPRTGEGETFRLSVQLAAGSASTLSYSGYDPSIVQVDEDGWVTALAPGKTKVTVKTFNKKSAKCTITVVNPYAPKSVKLDKKGTVSMKVGDVLTLNAILSPDGAYDDGLKWTSSKETVASVEDGIVTAKKAGSAAITVITSNGKKAKVKVKVK